MWRATSPRWAARSRWSGVVGDDAAGHEALRPGRRRGRRRGLSGHRPGPADHGEDPLRLRRPAAAARRPGGQPRRSPARSSSALVRTIARRGQGRGRDPALRLRQGRRHRGGDRRLPRGRRGSAARKLVVDSKARSFARYGAVDLIKPNAAELAHATDLPTETDAEVEAALARALELCEAKAILVTRAAKGMSLAVRGEPVRHFPTAPREVFDTSGAGDTALAALGLALAAGVAVEEAIALRPAGLRRGGAARSAPPRSRRTN